MLWANVKQDFGTSASLLANKRLLTRVVVIVQLVLHTKESILGMSFKHAKKP